MLERRQVRLAHGLAKDGSGQDARATVARASCPPPLFLPQSQRLNERYWAERPFALAALTPCRFGLRHSDAAVITASCVA